MAEIGRLQTAAFNLSLLKGVTISFFMRKGVFVFTDFNSQSTSKEWILLNRILNPRIITHKK